MRAASHLLVTGGAGFIGSAFVRWLVRDDPDIRITILDKLTYAGGRDNLAEVEAGSRLRFVEGDICDGSVVEALARETDAIVNFAAESHVDRSLQDAASFVRTDVQGVYVLLEAASRFGHHRFLQVSTDEVYGHVAIGRVDEQAPLHPRSPYSATKAGAELLAEAFRVSHGVPVLITRGCNTYGPFQFPEKIVPLFITNALDGLPLPIYGDGSAVRDYVHVDDHVRAIAAVLERGLPGSAYNIGTGAEVSAMRVADTVLAMCGRPASLKHPVEDRRGHDYRYALDATRIQALGWSPTYRFEEGLAGTVDWYRHHEDWWRKRKSSEFWSFYRRNYRGLPADAAPRDQPAASKPGAAG